jgi:hypothetical protein
MRRLLAILLLFQVVEAGATHWLTYYVYVETEYAQGPWWGTRLLDRSDYRYLVPREYTDLFGTESLDLALKMMQRLGETDPEAYDWQVEIDLQGDTAVLMIDQPVPQWERVRNEVTATLTMNGFRAVLFSLADTMVVSTLHDLTLPYFDLVEPGGIRPGFDTDVRGPAVPPPASSAPLQENGGNLPRNPLKIWLILSLLLNLALGISLMIKIKR